MKITKIEIKNFRSIGNEEINCGDYNLIVGQNNAGKSSILKAIQYFYDEYDLDLNDFKKGMKDLSVTLHIALDDTKTLNYFSDEKGKKYLIENNQLVIRKSAEITEGNIKGNGRRGLLSDSKEYDQDNKFFGFSGVSKNLLGDIIFIPAVRDVGDEIKTSSKYTTLMKLVRRVVSPKLNEDEKFIAINETIKSFNESGLFSGIESDINVLMKGYDSSIKFDFEPIDTEQIISSVSLSIIEEGLDKLPVSHKGTGLQRALMVNLIKYWAAEEKKLKSEKAKTNPPTILLFEEPEAFQHPQKEIMLFNELMQISHGNSQVFATSHSSNFVTESDQDLTNISVLRRTNADTFIRQVKQSTLVESANSKRFKFWKYLDGEKKKLFFAEKVILCEGNTERLIISYLLKDLDYIKKSKVTVIDANGKFQMPHFIRILNDLKIDYYLIYDKDGNTEGIHKDTNDLIDALTSDSSSCMGRRVAEDDIEIDLFGEKVNNKDKMLVIEKIENNEANPEMLTKIEDGLMEFIEIVKHDKLKNNQ